MAKPEYLQDEIIAQNVGDIELAMGRFLRARERRDYSSMMFQLGLIAGGTMSIYNRNAELERKK